MPVHMRPVLAILLFLTAANVGWSEEPHPGAKMYQSLCANCHGKQGEGTIEHAPDPLVGDRSLRELTEYISESMPEDDPAQCEGEDAARVASYIFDAFYSPIAQARLKPVRIEVSRLTVNQYENAVADLVTSFRGTSSWNGGTGLAAEYFKTRRTRREDRVLERVDPVVDFDFGEGVPEGPEGTDFDKPEEFSIQWRGSVFAPETGDYEFIVETDNGARLWVNDRETALIDAWVKSGDQTEYRGALRLLGGRAYPIRLEYFKFKDKRASVRLKWKAPHHAEEVVPARLLSKDSTVETFILNTPFPPDDASAGYERGTLVSQEWDEASTYAALEIAKYLTAHLGEFSRSKPDDADRKAKVQALCEKFVERAFHRPLNDELKEFFVAQHFREVESVEDALQRCVILTLKSPRFTFREFGQSEFDAYDTAAWLSFSLWDSLPDQQLLDAAGKGQLSDRAGIERQAQRMVNDLRTRAKLARFFRHWLRVNHFPDIAKDKELYPEFDEQVVSDLRTSLELFVNDIAWSEKSDFRELLKSDEMYVNQRLASLYGVTIETSRPDEFQRVQLPNQQRAGVLTHPYLMAGFGYDKTSSPIHRGVFLAKSVLGRFIKPPPIAVAPFAPDLHPGLTTRRRIELQTSPEACQNCHGMINPLGFSLEHFDTIGRYRSEEFGKPVDSTGDYFAVNGTQVSFDGSAELSQFLITSPEPQVSFVNQLFQSLINQPAQAFDLKELDRLRGHFEEHEFSIRSEIVEISVSTALKAKAVSAELAQSDSTP
ncbi:MAG: DUF1592 domain-containing protein [Planctomycetaceae bacterium]|nr:DUF1592 domain-containing protein [Planctomycetaceae bacterium]MCB9950468.1 DUF1592 domain-containing protein [Planctomycetaceae bacterium]